MIETINAPAEGSVLRGDVLGGALLRGWTGPASRRSTGAKGAAYNHAGSWGPMHWTHGGSSLHTCSGPDLELDCRRPEVRDRVVRVLAEGEKCPGCHQGWAPAVGPMGEPDGTPCEVCGGKTRGCIPGTGYLRAPVHLGHVTDAERRGRLSAEVAAWWLWLEVMRADAGLPPVRDLAAPWRHAGVAGCPPHCHRTERPSRVRDAVVVHARIVARHRKAPAWWAPLSEQDADIDAIAAGYILDNGDHLLLPHPDGVMRVDLERGQ